MNLYFQDNLSSIVFQPACLTHMPSSVEVSDIWGNGGSGIGRGSHSTRTALGEYFERRHFYMEIIPCTTGKLSHTLTKKEQLKLGTALIQTSSKTTTLRSINRHEFNLTKVYRAKDFTECFIPSALISLSSHKIEKDNELYPLRDTCGCSFHRNAEKAIFGSLKEQLERQFLVRYWLTSKCRKILSQVEIDQLKIQGPASAIYSNLINTGSVSVIDISDRHFPGKCLLLVYGNDSESASVRYCAGMAYSATPAEALEKSLLELWQTYRFMDVFHTTNGRIREIHDPYLQHFMNCNHYKTYADIVAFIQEGSSQDIHTMPFTTQGLLDSLNANEITGFIYLKPIQIEGATYFAAKYVSPDLFLHMNSSRNINLSNQYSAHFFEAIMPERQQVMVPFP
ncbi:YcaO-like family protein [Pseudomonas sp. SZMC_28357]|uniref:YcaO-like family protein n=1 Tax=Pseudomonas sp. SZMC_28357 TaxID=3074380 RepID=UPI002870E87C|nr:YcaO-like family protein [Pseudomonas sp. SZMC_28357]MDR9751774.1 YcaO-like family protein [Pseudomonas sp. SZMC_28357]